jgi:hypothetical protein
LPQAAVIVLFVFSVCLLLVFLKLMCHFAMVDGAWPQQQSAAVHQSSSVGAASSHAVDSSATARPVGSSTPCDDKWAVTQLQVSSLLRPLVLYMQYALILASVTGVELPAPLAYPLQALAWPWSPAVPETLSVECILPHGSSSSVPVSIQRMLFYLAMPFVMLLLLLVLHMLARALSRDRQVSSVNVTATIVLSATVVLLFFLPTLQRVALGWFVCIPIDVPVAAPYAARAVGSFWLHDPDQRCYQGYHRAWALGLGLPLLLLVAGLLPAAILWVTLRNRQLEQQLPGETSSFNRSYKIMDFIYKPTCRWWEVVVMFELAVLAAVAVSGPRLGPLLHTIAFCCVLAVMGWLQITAQPYRFPAANYFMLQCLCCLFFSTMANVLFLNSGSFRASAAAANGVGSVVLCSNVVLVGSVLRRLVRLLSRQQGAGGAGDKSVTN